MDLVNVSTGEVANAVLMLDRGIMIAAIANAVADDAVPRAFIDPKTQRILESLMDMEDFSADPATANSASRQSASSFSRFSRCRNHRSIQETVVSRHSSVRFMKFDKTCGSSISGCIFRSDDNWIAVSNAISQRC